MYELQRLMDDVSEWSDKTFGVNQRNPGILNHLSEEVNELIGAFNKCQIAKFDHEVDLDEYEDKIKAVKNELADCFMLLIDSATHMNYTAEDLIFFTRRKLEINKNREWGKPDKDGVVRHIKDKNDGE